MTILQTGGERPASEGETPLSDYIAERLTERRRFLHQSAALGSEAVIRDELAALWHECRVPDWDGYEALPVSRAALNHAERLLWALPLGTEPPSVGALPNGYVTLEWHHSRRRSLSVAVSPEGDLHYAALLGPGKTCGTEPFFEEVPPAILDLIRRVYRC